LKIRICKICKEEKPIEGFGFFTYKTVDGVVHTSIRWTCKECIYAKQMKHEETQIAYRDANKEKIALYYKNKEIKKNTIQTKIRWRNNKKMAIKYLGRICMDCKGIFPDCVFDFHHRDPLMKTATIGSLITHSWEKIKIELDKCDLLCANCHRIRHHAKA